MSLCPTCGKPGPLSADERHEISSRGGKARKAVLSPERRREIAVNAAKARWAKSACHIAGGM